jgi:hypothetical protein
MKKSDKTPADIGIELSRVLCWDGEAIFIAAIAALTDANYHKEARALLRAWEQINRGHHAATN